MNRKIVCSLQSVSKVFPDNGIRACSDISLDIKEGEVLAIMGENGAGKSTLMHLIAGTLKPSSGQIIFNEEEASVGILHQRPLIAPHMPLWESLFCGNVKGFFKSPQNFKAELSRVQEKYNLPLDLNTKGWELSAAEMQRAELIEALYKNATILVFDEPTASLSESQSEEMIHLIKILRSEGRSILFISHNINEAFKLSDRVAVLRKGELISTDDTGSISPQSISQNMMGDSEYQMNNCHRSIEQVHDKENLLPPLFALKNISYTHLGVDRLKNISLNVRPGEILGLGGIRENGLFILEDLLAGLIHPQSGNIEFNQEILGTYSPHIIRKLNISYIPADRLRRGASLNSTLAENLALLKRKLSGKQGSYKAKISLWAKTIIPHANIKGDPKQIVGTLSGGNIQKMIMARELHKTPPLIIISEPSWGMDFKSRDEFHGRIEKTAQNGSAVILLTTDLDELLKLSDRIMILTGGQLDEIPQNQEYWNRVSIGEKMTGADRK